MSVWLALLLVALGLPRTVLADLDVVAPESGLLYYVLALVPFAVWLGVAVVRPSRRPFLDFLMVGVLYGLSLAVVHQALWSVGPYAGNTSRLSSVGIALMIGVGSGVVVGIVALGANAWRRRVPAAALTVGTVVPTVSEMTPSGFLGLSRKCGWGNRSFGRSADRRLSR